MSELHPVLAAAEALDGVWTDHFDDLGFDELDALSAATKALDALALRLGVAKRTPAGQVVRIDAPI